MKYYKQQLTGKRAVSGAPPVPGAPVTPTADEEYCTRPLCMLELQAACQHKNAVWGPRSRAVHHRARRHLLRPALVQRRNRRDADQGADRRAHRDGVRNGHFTNLLNKLLNGRRHLSGTWTANKDAVLKFTDLAHGNGPAIPVERLPNRHIAQTHVNAIRAFVIAMTRAVDSAVLAGVAVVPNAPLHVTAIDDEAGFADGFAPFAAAAVSVQPPVEHMGLTKFTSSVITDMLYVYEVLSGRNHTQAAERLKLTLHLIERVGVSIPKLRISSAQSVHSILSFALATPSIDCIV